MQIIWAALRAGKLVNASEFAAQLEVSTKTIHRDLEYMRWSLGFAFEYDGSQFGYRVSAEHDHCPWCCPPNDVLAPYYFSRRSDPIVTPIRGKGMDRQTAKRLDNARIEAAEKLKAARKKRDGRSARNWSKHNTQSATRIRKAP